jgi:mercuric reductase
MTVNDRYDLIILGSGAAAFAAVLKASELDVKVAMVERGTVGGTCVNVGCVPSKNLLRAGEIIYYSKHPNYDAISSNNGKFSVKEIVKKKDELVLSLRNAKYVNVLDSLPNVTLIKGSASFVSKNEVKVNGKNFYGKKFIIATGSSTNVPLIQGINDVDYLTNVEALSLKESPDSMIVLGGGPLGLEFAQMYAHFGTEVTLLQRSSRIAPKEEPEISEALKQYLEEERIKIHTNAQVLSVRKKGDVKILRFNVNGDAREIETEQLLVATGRRPNTADLHPENAGVKLRQDGAVIVNPEMRTSSPHIWAGGDVIGMPMLETIAAKEGAITAENALKNAGKKIDLLSVPHAIFTSPQIASVGLTEGQMMENMKVCSCRTLSMSEVPKAKVVHEERGLIKMAVHPKTGRIFGVHILAELAADMIHEAVLAVKYKLTVDDIIDTVHVFPTMTEAIKLVATAFKKDVSKLSCCAE